MSDQLIWGYYDVLSKKLDKKITPEMEAGCERFNAERFKRLYSVFRMDHFAGRIVELDSSKVELPTNSILHILDDVKNPVHSDLFDVNHVFLKNESFRKFLYHVREPNLSGPLGINDKYIYRASGLPTTFMRFRSEHGNMFRYCNTIEELPKKAEALIVVNHNPVLRAQFFGRLQYFRKIQLLLTSILNTAFSLRDLKKQQYILIPWDNEVFQKQEFLRTREKLTPVTVKHPESFHYILMMHIANFLWSEATTSCFKQLPEEALDQINLILECNGKYIFYNLAALQNLNVKNRAYHRCINQMNALSVLSNPDATEETKKYFTEEMTKASEDDTENAKTYDIKNAKDAEVEVTPNSSYEEEKEQVLNHAVRATPAPLGVIHRNNASPLKVTKDTEDSRDLQPTNPEVTIAKVPEVAPHALHSKQPKQPKQHTKVKTKASTNSAHKAESDTNNNYAAEFIQQVEKDADTFIENTEHLTPKQKQRAKQLARKCLTLDLGGRKIEDILNEDTDSSIDQDVLTNEILGMEIPDQSALKSSIYSFDRSYMQKTNLKHLAGIITSFARNGVFLVGVKEEKVISELNNYTSYTLQYEDIDGKKSSVKFKVPMVDREGRVKIDGIQKVLKKQRLTLPIVKISDTEVSLSSNYNKTRVIRVTTKAHSYFNYIDSYVNSTKSNAEVVYGTCTVRDVPLSYEYATIADRYKSITFTDKDKQHWELFFDYHHRLEHFGGSTENLAQLESNYGTYCGHNNTNNYFINNFNKITAVNKQGGEDPENALVTLDQIFKLSLKEGETVKKQLTEWVNCKILDAFIPVVFILAYRFGLRATLDYLGVKYTITEGRSKIITAESDKNAKYPNLRAGNEGFKDKMASLVTGGKTRLVCPVLYKSHKIQYFLGDWIDKKKFTPGKYFKMSWMIQDKKQNFVQMDIPHFKSMPELLRWLKSSCESVARKYMTSLGQEVNNETIVVIEKDLYDYFRLSKDWFGTRDIDPKKYAVQKFPVYRPLLIDDLLKEAGTAGTESASIKITTDGPKELKHIYHQVSGCKYGFYDTTTNGLMDEHNESDGNYLNTHARVLTPEEVLEKKIGTCWDQSLTLAYLLHREGIEFIYNFMEKPSNETHTFVIAKFENNYYWLETAWYKHRGIHGPYQDLHTARSAATHLFFADAQEAHRGVMREISSSTVESLWRDKHITLPKFLKVMGFKYYEQGTEDLREYARVTDNGEWFYHISPILDAPSVTFTPQVPDVYKQIEDHTTPRVCVSTNIQGCLISTPAWNEMQEQPDGGYRFTVYAIRKSSLPDTKIVTNQELVDKKLVWDAHITNENWILDKVTMKRIGQITAYPERHQNIYYQPLGRIDDMKKWPQDNQGNLIAEICDYTWTEGRDPNGDPKVVKAIAGTEAAVVSINTPSQSKLVTDDGVNIEERRYVPKVGDIAIKFADKVLWFNRYPLKQSLVVAGLDNYDLSNYEMAAFESKDIYYQLLVDRGMSINYLKGIDSFFDLFIDNMTYSVLRSMHEPTNLRDLLLRSVELLTTLDYRPPSSKVNHRIRGYEQFNAIIYNEMSRQLAAYQTRRGKGNLFSINPEAVYLRIMQNASMIPSESPNPLQDIKEQTYMTYAGVGGRTDESFVVNDRRFAKDDVGVISESTVDNKKVGLNAQLSFDPLIENTEGLLGESDNIQPANFLSIYGLMFPFATHDDKDIGINLSSPLNDNSNGEVNYDTSCISEQRRILPYSKF